MTDINTKFGMEKEDVYPINFLKFHLNIQNTLRIIPSAVENRQSGNTENRPL